MVLLKSSINPELRREVTFREGPDESSLRPEDKLSLSKASLSRTSSRAGRGFGNADNDLAYSTQPSELAHIQRLHAQLLGHVESLTDRALQPDQIPENEHLRSFRLRLCKADEELARHEVGPKLDWRQEALNMADQLENTHVLVCRLEHQIKVMQERFQNVQSQSQEREDEHRAVLQQVAALETENAKLKKSAAAKPAPAHSQSWRESTTAKSELSTSMPSNRPQTAGLSTSDRRLLEDAVRRYKKLLDAESQRTREARAAYLAVEAEFHKYRTKELATNQSLDLQAFNVVTA